MELPVFVRIKIRKFLRELPDIYDKWIKEKMIKKYTLEEKARMVREISKTSPSILKACWVFVDALDVLGNFLKKYLKSASITQKS